MTEHFRSLIQNSWDIILVLDADGTIRYVGPSIERILGYKPEDLINQNVFKLAEFYYPHKHTVFREIVNEALSSSNTSIVTECWLRHCDGSRRYFEVIGQNLLDQPSISGIVLNLHDITERKRVEKELSMALHTALEASRVKSQFLTMVSHEIRTPLTAIIGIAEVLKETPLTLEQQKYVNVLETAGNTLLILVNDILDFSKVESGTLSLDQVHFDIRELVEKAIAAAAVRAGEKGLTLTVEIMPDVPSGIMGDPGRLTQILLNILENAIKFTERGEVVLRIKNNPDAKDDEGLLFSISDTGIGISEEKLNTIFDSFTQVDSSIRRKYGGTGLGLAISSRLVNLMGGRMWVESTQGIGSTFYFTIKFGSPSMDDPYIIQGGKR
ncbi:PAS domain-containing hybrid sensor histidine kinase/response regulator [Effusibacillus consociatus]